MTAPVTVKAERFYREMIERARRGGVSGYGGGDGRIQSA